ncbi:putative secreted protein (Por secretion system target) [Lutibacter oceani]|uniref:Putative secreted protein (Por secretion system target) n=1 Tax=Lutibacter oceani TaxID=1853311 RepID=A0A3D9RPT5_9FLAO|nr:endonuclease [Lutibacter oceani]REE81953.1 putative secreted protein (Por secretion system target) [Lutibacter oceani]
MKKLLLLFYLISITVYSQIPAGYYDTATGTGYTLKTQLYNIILGHTDNGYTPGLWDTYQTSDRDIYYENDNTILDMYSENPTAVDPYNFTYSTDQCGTYANEGDCYNREHIIPQSVFNQLSPMRNDAHFITPTDGKVNGYRSNYPHGMVGTATYTSQNGSKLGSGLNSGYSAGYTGTVFEPIDEFKGDIARMYFYFATRYENVITSWGVSYDMFDGTSDKVFAEPFLTILMTWHTNDPVSTREIDRNNAIYARQNNRNPFIDHPEYVSQIWSTTPDTQAPTAPTNLIASNITNTTADLNWTASTDDVGVTSYEIFKDGVFLTSSATNSYNITGLTQNTSYNFTVYAKDAFGNTSTVSNTETFTTTNIIDVDAPTVPTALIVSNETSSTIDLSWTASTDNVGVTGYDIYVDGIYNATTASVTYTITGLTPTTTYSFTVLAKDGATNESAQSSAVNGTTTAIPSFCTSETFTNIGASSSSYTTVNWTGDDGGSWSSTDTRTDQTLTGSAITIRNGILTASTTANGIGDLTVTTQLVFTGSSGTFNLKVNGSIVGSIPYSSSIQTTTITGINISGNVAIVFDGNSTTSNRVIFDDLSWTCYASPDTEAPTAIVDLTSSNITSSSVDLYWSAATDNVGVTSYEVYKDGVFLASSPTNSYAVSGLSGSTSYDFTIYAKDAAGNTSLVSNTETFTTLGGSSVASELFISEYVEGSGTNKAIEIANFTGGSVNLAIYSLARQSAGAGAWRTVLNLSGTIVNNDVFVVANSSDGTIVAAADYLGTDDALLFNGDDPVGLFKNGILIDVVGTYNGATGNFAKDVTLRRKPAISSPNTTYTLSEWDSYPIDTYSGLGSHTLSSLSVQEFVENLFNVYPNPTNTKSVTISVNNNETISAVQLYNLIGQLIIDIKNPNGFQSKIEVTDIPSGFYIVKVFNEKTYSTKRLIVE